MTGQINFIILPSSHLYSESNKKESIHRDIVYLK